MLIDTHAHIYSDSFRSDRPDALRRAREAGVGKILMPAIDSSTHAAMLELEDPEGFCTSMMGLHPCSVKEDMEEELAAVEAYLQQRPFIAVGEIGLDFYWDLSFKEQQYEAFQRQVRWALEYDLPIVIHSRNATEECIEVVQRHQNGKLRGVFHCFSGTASQALQVTELGFYLGIGGVLTFKNGGLDDIVRATDLSRIVLETDAPYLAPVPYRGKRNEPSYVWEVAQKLADIREMPLAAVEEITTANAKALFRL